jgi:hypothetical protein
MSTEATPEIGVTGMTFPSWSSLIPLPTNVMDMTKSRTLVQEEGF